MMVQAFLITNDQENILNCHDIVLGARYDWSARRVGLVLKYPYTVLEINTWFGTKPSYPPQVF